MFLLDKDTYQVFGLLGSNWIFNISNFAAISTAILNVLGIAYLLWKWNKRIKKK